MDPCWDRVAGRGKEAPSMLHSKRQGRRRNKERYIALRLQYHCLSSRQGRDGPGCRGLCVFLSLSAERHASHRPSTEHSPASRSASHYLPSLKGPFYVSVRIPDFICRFRSPRLLATWRCSYAAQRDPADKPLRPVHYLFPRCAHKALDGPSSPLPRSIVKPQ